MEPKPYELQNYLTADNLNPFRRWIRGLDGSVRSVIQVRLRRIEEYGNFGDCQTVGDGVFELRIYHGPGYRVYFGLDGETVILLGGGDKGAQESDIRKSKERWKDYNA